MATNAGGIYGVEVDREQNGFRCQAKEVLDIGHLIFLVTTCLIMAAHSSG